ncbi:hypothetical protein ScPMuIL_005736 [Solemya velum]
MADLYEPDAGTAYYRSSDPLKNLRIKVHLDRVTSSSIIPQAVTEAEDAAAAEAAAEKGGDAARDGPPQKDTDEVVIRWQEKIFSQKEVEIYSKEENCIEVLEKKYHIEVTALLEKGKPSNRIFTYVDHDKFLQSEEAVNDFMTDKINEPVTVLAEKMAHMRRRRIAGGKHIKEKPHGFVPKVNVLEAAPSEEMKNRNHIMAAPVQVMYIMGDLSPRERAIEDGEECILCSIQMDANGVLCIKPDFNQGRKQYVVETTGVGREVFEYTVENASEQMNRQERDRELKMLREVYTRHKDFLMSCVGQDFELPPPDSLRLVVYGEIESASNFEYDNLYIHFFVDLPPCEYLLFLNGIRLSLKSSQVKSEFFNQPGQAIPKFPILMIEVLSLDSWSRFRTEGYAYLPVPTKPGVSRETVTCWRPVGSSVSSQLRRFFIGGSPELEDPTYVAVPSTYGGSHLSKFGFRTETTGSVTVRLNTVFQSRSFMEKKASKQTLGALLDTLGMPAIQANVANVLDAFRKARMRMLGARDNASKHLKEVGLQKELVKS